MFQEVPLGLLSRTYAVGVGSLFLHSVDVEEQEESAISTAKGTGLRFWCRNFAPLKAPLKAHLKAPLSIFSTFDILMHIIFVNYCKNDLTYTQYGLYGTAHMGH